MSENVESLVLEQLRAIRGEMAKMADYMHTLQAEMTAMRQSLASIRTLQDHDHSDIAALKIRIERIERRLDLVD
jgi:capsule polysaccharide export protein KpsE/RkpR